MPASLLATCSFVLGSSSGPGARAPGVEPVALASNGARKLVVVDTVEGGLNWLFETLSAAGVIALCCGVIVVAIFLVLLWRSMSGKPQRHPASRPVVSKTIIVAPPDSASRDS